MAFDPTAPPIYSQQDPDELTVVSTDSLNGEHPQLLIIPTTDELNFQVGYLGADDERASLEGELQIKGAEPGSWSKLTICLRTVETVKEREVELTLVEIVLFDRPLNGPETSLPSSFPFAIPLMADTPQSLVTPHSSLRHTLMATLFPVESLPSLQPVSKTIEVHTKRYTSAYVLPTSPETYSVAAPTPVHVEVPRTTFKAGETIPIYLTVPPPARELVVDQGLRLRNVKVELLRMIRIKEEGDDDASPRSPNVESAYNRDWYFANQPTANDGPSSARNSNALLPPTGSSSTKGPKSPASPGSSYTKTIARSGASCRFHSSRPVQLRFILHSSPPSGSSSDFSDFPPSPPGGPSSHFETDGDCTITQSTLLHSVTFCLRLSISFVDMSTHTERFSTVSIPINIIAPAIPLGEVDHAVDIAYQKKHDRRPAKTVREDEGEFSAPLYSEGEAGPSGQANGAPPPFEERGAPPPFFLEPSTSTRLPTFLESETDIVPTMEDDLSETTDSTIGEGIEFGFTAASQFDGHSQADDMIPSSSTPPPTLDESALDTDLTPFIDTSEPPPASEPAQLNSDPPPSIYSDYYPVEPMAPSAAPTETTRAPPPYLPDTTNVYNPPPYL